MLETLEIAGQVPFLRRYARALTGSQGIGDALVVATLEALAKDSAFAAAADKRVAIFRLLSTLWNSTAGQLLLNHASKAEVLPGSGPERRLHALTPLSRQAFLLVFMEGFSEPEAANILDVDETKFQRILEIARREIAEQVATDVLIIEDELFIAADLERIVTELGHRVTGIKRTHVDAVTASQVGKPGLILADIQLADGSSGLEAVNEILAKHECPVIFITGYPDRLLTGLKPEPTFLIAKPFLASTVTAVVSQALFFDANARLTP